MSIEVISAEAGADDSGVVFVTYELHSTVSYTAMGCPRVVACDPLPRSAFGDAIVMPVKFGDKTYWWWKGEVSGLEGRNWLLPRDSA